eukprot:TRINITY_DN8699_c0_g1_i5.p2 TRINITY_DN8699_c0_g1~~TRINITY_DN8699_c0_g1_i5.p2  ORF type:complete len:115 (+),score=19.66 TRINITY_DN8699_c0_g1_i5:309-653(+)
MKAGRTGACKIPWKKSGNAKLGEAARCQRSTQCSQHQMASGQDGMVTECATCHDVQHAFAAQGSADLVGCTLRLVGDCKSGSANVCNWVHANSSRYLPILITTSETHLGSSSSN